MLKKHLNYANVIASAALLVALGGTAVAAATLTRDSVGAPQIRADAVRSSEIRSQSVKIPDIATEARSALLSDVEVAEDSGTFVPSCPGTDLTACPNLLALRLNTSDGAEANARRRRSSGGPVQFEKGRNWLIQAKFTIDSANPTDPDDDNRCGLVLDSSTGADTLLDEARHHLGTNDDPADSEAQALTAVLSDDRFVDPRIALRCTRQAAEELEAEDQKLTALEVGKVIGP
jgi:hypothetical protein